MLRFAMYSFYTRLSLGLVGLLWLESSALAAGPAEALPVTVSHLGSVTLEPGGPLKLRAVLTNQTDQPVSALLEYEVQEDPALYSRPAPMPRYGTNVAAGSHSWYEIGGKVYDDSSMTDGKPWTDFGGPMNNKEMWDEAFATIDLGRPVRVVHLGRVGGNASRIYEVDFAASLDGKVFQTIPGLTNLDFHLKWAPHEIEVPEPFTTRFLRLRLHHNGQRVPVLSLPAEFLVYDGEHPGTWDFPAAGTRLLKAELTQTIPAHRSLGVDLGDGRALGTGAYLVALRTKTGGLTQMHYGRILVMPPALEKVTRDSRFGMNGIRLPALGRRQGYGWVRFENLKWSMVSAEPGKYSFDGTLSPYQKYDEIFRSYREQGLFTMPYLFLTPKYMAPKDAKNQGMTHPPTDLSKYGEFVFQAVARYGSRRHPPEALLTTDKVSGLGYIDLFELWNEADLNDPNWGSWRGRFEDYYIMFRHGAEAVKRADPAARVANGGWSGMDVPLMETMRNYKYPDGQCPLDFTDVLSVHYYSFQVPPERAQVNDNTHRNGAPLHGMSFEEELDALVAWRDQHKPALPIWISETGYDTGGPKGVDERFQACWLPRDLMMILAAGVAKVQVFRETGSGGDLFSASGVVRDDGSLKPSWFTYATLIRQLDGVTERPLKMTFADPNLRAYLWARGRQRILTAWAIQGRAALDLPPGRCTLTDAFGASKALDPASGAVELTEFPIYLTGFTPAAAQALVEQAMAMAEQERQKVERQSRLQACLFEFGATNRSSTLRVGSQRRFTDVLAGESYDEAKGYGFETQGLADRDERWLRPPFSVKVVPGARFTFKARPGRYELQVCARANAEGRVLVRGLEGGAQTLKLIPQRDGAIAKASAQVGSKPITVETGFHGELVWVTLIERE